MARTFRPDDNDICLVQDQQTDREFDFYCTFVLTHWNNSPHVATVMFPHSRHINPSMSQHVFIPECCMFSEEAENTHFIGKLVLPDQIYHNEDKHTNNNISKAEHSTVVK